MSQSSTEQNDKAKHSHYGVKREDGTPSKNHAWEMERLSLGMEHQQNQVQWRRDKVQELYSKGYSQREISQTLQVGLATVNRDVSIRY
jgi:Trp operon repressor